MLDNKTEITLSILSNNQATLFGGSMQNTMNLLAEAEKVKDLSAWADEIGLSKRVLYTSKYREHLSPAVAGALAEKLGLDPKEWIVIAALESERESACKSRMVRKFLTGAAIAGTLMGAAGTATAAVASTAARAAVCILC
ncbi:hypothetical protein [Thauera sp. SWB20]|uniref:hypothetical protein n=1 Tax=Thauera sp. SWB20 TaxID=1572758 RepID=UPI0018CEB480|nr:hypothetical protein [Thauera sp. SWB20]